MPLKDEMMPESPEESAPQKDAPPPQETSAEPNSAPPAAAPPAEQALDSATFSRCAECKHAEGVNSAAGTLICKKHNMLINAEADEIPDDCPEHEPKDG